jgi:transposase-like protein
VRTREAREEATMTKTTIEEIQTALVRSNEGAGRPYPARLRGAVLALAEQRERAGVGLASFAAEVGVSATTLRKWKRDARGGEGAATAAFCEVEIVAPRALGATLVVHGPSGLRIEGATIADIAELVRRLS